MKKLYTLSELKLLKVGDEVYVEYKHYEDGSIKENTKVHTIDDNYVYFDDGFDFPFNDWSVETEFAVQDDGDYTFKIFKI